MGRTSLYPDRIRIHRFTSKVVRKEVIQSSEPVPVTDWIPCLYRTPSGRTDRLEGRSYLPENATLVIHHTDDSGSPVRLHPEDLLELQYGNEGTYLGGPAPRDTRTVTKEMYKIEGEIVRTRAKRLIESYVVEIVLDKEF